MNGWTPILLDLSWNRTDTQMGSLLQLLILLPFLPFWLELGERDVSKEESMHDEAYEYSSHLWGLYIGSETCVDQHLYPFQILSGALIECEWLPRALETILGVKGILPGKGIEHFVWSSFHNVLRQPCWEVQHYLNFGFKTGLLDRSQIYRVLTLITFRMGFCMVFIHSWNRHKWVVRPLFWLAFLPGYWLLQGLCQWPLEWTFDFRQ